MEGDMGAREVNVKIIATGQVNDENGPATILTYRIINEMQNEIWIVDDGWIKWYQENKLIKLSLKREKMRKGVEVFGYFPPRLVKLLPRQHLEKIIKLGWPVSLSRIWNEKDKASPAPGHYRLNIIIGYGMNDSILSEEDFDSIQEYEEKISQWQKEATSNEVLIEIPPY